MSKNLTREGYIQYIQRVQYWILDTEDRIERLETYKKIASLSFEDWVKWQKGELSVKDL